MDTIIKAAGLCLAAAVIASLLRKESPELGILLAAAAALLGGALVLSAALDLVSLGGELLTLTGLPAELFTPLWKVTAIALIARVGSALCTDAGQEGLARVMDAAGAFCALGCAVPLLQAVMELIRGWL